MAEVASPHIVEVSTAAFQAQVLEKSLEIPVLVDFWATWCGPCKTLGPLLEKLAAEFGGGFVLAKVDVEAEQQLAAYFQIRSVPTVMLVKDGQIVDGFPGALPEAQIRQFLSHHGIVPQAVEPEPAEEAAPPPRDPHAEVASLRAAIAAEPARDELRLDLALALARIGESAESEALLDALPANLASDDRARRTRSALAFSALLKNAPAVHELERRIAADSNDLAARHLLGAQRLVAGESEAALQQFLEMLRIDRNYGEGLPKRSLIDAFNVIEDEDLVGVYRRRMASLLF